MPFWNKIDQIPFWRDSEFAKDSAHIPRIALSINAREWLAARPVDRPRLLVCHDMMGGYSSQDCYPDGNSQLSSVFTFSNWAAIDEFIYFSHHRVTIPPAQWTNLAHVNGCLSYGTFIFGRNDGDDIMSLIYDDPRNPTYGSPSNKICEELVAMAKHFELDGWFIDIQRWVYDTSSVINIVDKKTGESTKYEKNTITLKDLLIAIFRLKIRLKEVCGEHTRIIMLNSLDIYGRVTFKNLLLEEDKIFFDSCSGIYTNFRGKENNLKDTALVAENIGKEKNKNGRKTDVYSEIDVFDRKHPGFCGFDSHIGVKLTFKFGFSCALFAPGWVHERNDHDEFLSVEKRVWDPILTLLPPPRPLMLNSKGKLITYFNLASGTSFSLEGDIVSQSQWSNHSLQSAIYGLEQPGVEITNDTAFFGSTCLKIQSKVDFFVFGAVKNVANLEAFAVVKGPIQLGKGKEIGNSGWRLLPVGCEVVKKTITNESDDELEENYKEFKISVTCTGNTNPQKKECGYIGMLAVSGGETALESKGELVFYEVWRNKAEFIKITIYPEIIKDDFEEAVKINYSNCELHLHDPWKIVEKFSIKRE